MNTILKRKNSTYLLIILVIILLTNYNFRILSKSEPNSSSFITSFSDIYITSDVDFQNLMLQGNGTLEEPYLIENLVFTNESVSGFSIYIKGTTKHFSILNCVFGAKNGGIYLENIAPSTAIMAHNKFGSIIDEECSGIEIANAQGARIVNCTFDRYYYAISEYDSFETSIQNNNFLLCNYGVLGFNISSTNISSNFMSKCDRGIVLHDSPNSFITNNTIMARGTYQSFSSDYTILVDDCDNTEISSNYLTDRLTAGINCIESEYCFIYNNSIDRTTSCITTEYSSDYTTILENHCTRSLGNGLSISGCEFLTVSQNNISESSSTGLFLDNVVNSIIINNDLVSSGFYGINLRKSHEVAIGQNYIARNYMGIFSDNSSFSDISYNFFHYNTLYGLYLDVDSFFNSVDHNEFVYNNLDGFSQGFDSGEGNIWYDENLEEGNFWTNYDEKDEYYEIDGSALSQDIYPSVSEHTNTNTASSFSIFWFLFSFSAIVVVIKNRTKRLSFK